MQQDRYDFIMSPGAEPKKRLLDGGGNSLKSRLLVAVGGGIALLIIGATVFSLVLGGGPTNQDQLIAIAQQQNELIRVSEIGVKKARDLKAKNLATTSQLSLTSDQQDLISALRKQNVKVAASELSAGKNAKTDDMLTVAEQNNRFDEAFLEHLQEELTDYQRKLKAAYDATANKTLKDTLASQYQHASLIIGAKSEI